MLTLTSLCARYRCLTFTHVKLMDHCRQLYLFPAGRSGSVWCRCADDHIAEEQELGLFFHRPVRIYDATSSLNTYEVYILQSRLFSSRLLLFFSWTSVADRCERRGRIMGKTLVPALLAKYLHLSALCPIETLPLAMTLEGWAQPARSVRSKSVRRGG